ncbi:MAG: tryptophan--tRNA ligase [Patescibacteria group bacterium]
MNKKILLSGIQPSGALHIGNYLGAIKQWVDLQSDYRVFAMIADLHAITVPQEPEALRSKTLEVAALLVACGIDPEKSVIFVQSHVPAHTQLAWVLNTITPLGELERMTQFKDKAHIKYEFWTEMARYYRDTGELLVQITKHLENENGNDPEKNLKLKIKITGALGQSGFETIDKLFQIEKTREEVLAGILNYPVLMAADILLYQTNVVPVGEDQQQHLELTRTLANKFNNRFGETFRIPKAHIQKDTARLMGLDDPSKKMSKSAPSANNYIGLLDTPDDIRRKIKVAVTDSGKEIIYDEEAKPAIANLLRIFSAFSQSAIADIENQYRGKSYAEFKNDLAELLVAKLEPIQRRYHALSQDEAGLRAALRRGAEQAHTIAQGTLRSVYEKVGFAV